MVYLNHLGLLWTISQPHIRNRSRIWSLQDDTTLKRISLLFFSLSWRKWSRQQLFHLYFSEFLRNGINFLNYLFFIWLKKVFGTPDYTYFAPDCFHLSAKGHQAAAIELWNSMVRYLLIIYNSFINFWCHFYVYFSWLRLERRRNCGLSIRVLNVLLRYFIHQDF